MNFYENEDDLSAKEKQLFSELKKNPYSESTALKFELL